MRLLARHLEQLLAYHGWAFQRLLESLQQVDDTAYHAPCGLFFSSLHGTLNHLAVVDRIWLARVRQEPAPFDRLDAEAVADRQLLPTYLAEGVSAWQVVLTRHDDDSLTQPLVYRNMRGEPQQRSLAEIITHVVNHGTHHRGQASAALSMMGLETPAMDFIYFKPESP
ncbi:DinB family protein [Metapseudomonas boanensis]|uniref:DinB family protein n=1 Tax=Metapseudomonas boanensis TaxID=2822138 RepID=A0ABS5XCD2_9GAMM|nr:DinB family protein [Pseudomonas boanensis]MBT8765355.1 DinB family protein [Pseudomonas boanensis]